MKYPWKNRKEKKDIMHSISVSIAEIAEIKNDFNMVYIFRTKALKEMTKMSNDEFNRFYQGYQWMNEVIREYCEETGVSIYEFKNPGLRV